jgi:hypothetical protein
LAGVKGEEEEVRKAKVKNKEKGEKHNPQYAIRGVWYVIRDSKVGLKRRINRDTRGCS